MSDTKQCSVCRKVLPLTAQYFYRSVKSKNGFKADCKDCHKNTRKSFTERQHQEMNDDCVRCEICGGVFVNRIQSAHLKAKHNMTVAEYRAMGHPVSSVNLRTKLTLQNQIAEIKRNYGKDHPNYKGGHIASSGYRVISRLGSSNLYEHRVVAEQKIGRPLASNEVVHHIDGNRLNNHPDNLQVMTQSEHTRLESRLRNRRIYQISDDTIKAVHTLYQLGWNQSSIARALRCEPSTIKSILDDTINL